MDRLNLAAFAGFAEFAAAAAFEVLPSGVGKPVKDVVVGRRTVSFRVKPATRSFRPRSLAGLDDVEWVVAHLVAARCSNNFASPVALMTFELSFHVPVTATSCFSS